MAGARSALFLPFEDLGLIIVDEEHDPAFKQEDRVFYHARDMAVVRARIAGFPVVLTRPFDRRTPSHQCGTARMGTDPATSVVDPFGRSHDHPNLFLADASILPTSAAVNPALTIAANALRAADHILTRDLAA